MPSAIAHAAVPFLIGRGAGLDRRAVIAASLLACLPDLDQLGVAFEVRPDAILGHRGISHSIAFAALLTLVCGRWLLRAQAKWWPSWVFLFCAVASHGLLDLLTHGEPGVALFYPLSSARVLFPVNPVPALPLSWRELWSSAGALVFTAEFTLLIVPAAIIGHVLRQRASDSWLSKPIIGLCAAWLVAIVSLNVLTPNLFSPQPRRVVSIPGDETPAQLPRELFARGEVISNFNRLRALGVFDKRLTPQEAPWSSSFFPYWFGGEAGRWQDPRPVLIGRTLKGFTPPTPRELENLLRAQARDPSAREALFRLSPTEKYDLAMGDLELHATRASLLETHNGRPRFWFGLCNGVAAAGLVVPEPRREVDVISRNGDVVRFHPTDIKALLGAAYYWTTGTIGFGGDCNEVAIDPGAICSMNPAAFVIVLLNRLGLSHESLLVDVIPSLQAQFYGVAAAEVDVVREPYPPNDQVAPAFKQRAAALVDLHLHLTASSTVLPLRTGDAADGEEGHYEAVGLRPVPFDYSVTLALDTQGDLVGGRWVDPVDGPDSVGFYSSLPETLDGGALAFRPELHWPAIAALAEASAQVGAGPASLRWDQPFDAGRAP